MYYPHSGNIYYVENKIINKNNADSGKIVKGNWSPLDGDEIKVEFFPTKFKLFALREYFPNKFDDYYHIGLLTTHENRITGLLSAIEDYQFDIFISTDTHLINNTTSIKDTAIPLTKEYLNRGSNLKDNILEATLFYLIPANTDVYIYNK